MDNVKEIRSLLVKRPQPAMVRVRSSDGEVRDMPTPPGSSWVEVARSLVALNPEAVELYDSSGGMLRAASFEADGKPSAIRPEMSIPPHADPETARLIHFSNLLYRATEFSITTAFTKMAELFELSAERMMALEARLERTEAAHRKVLNQQIQDAFDAAQAGEPNTIEEMVRGFMESMQLGQSETAAISRTNGKGQS